MSEIGSVHDPAMAPTDEELDRGTVEVDLSAGLAIRRVQARGFDGPAVVQVMDLLGRSDFRVVADVEPVLNAVVRAAIAGVPAGEIVGMVEILTRRQRAGRPGQPMAPEPSRVTVGSIDAATGEIERVAARGPATWWADPAKVAAVLQAANAAGTEQTS